MRYDALDRIESHKKEVNPMNGRKAKELRREHPELPHPQRLRGGVVGANFEAPQARRRQKRLRLFLKQRAQRDDA